MTSKLRIFLADDHAVLRKGLYFLINSQTDMEVVGEAGDGQEACQRARELQPDVVVMDLSMPNMDGYQATAALKQTCPQIKILVLTVFEDSDSLHLLLKSGASGYVLKSMVAEELTQAIRRVAAGGVYLDPMLVGRLVDSTVGKSPSRSGPTTEALSSREIEVMRLLAWGTVMLRLPSNFISVCVPLKLTRRVQWINWGFAIASILCAMQCNRVGYRKHKWRVVLIWRPLNSSSHLNPDEMTLFHSFLSSESLIFAHLLAVFSLKMEQGIGENPE